MEKELYNKYIKEWEEYSERSKEYYKKRKAIIDKYRDSDESLWKKEDKELDDLEKEYGWDGFNPYQFGPWTVIDDSKDLKDPNFKLPGYNKSYSELKNAPKDLPNWFGLVAECVLSNNNRGIIVGYGYDATDDYLVIKKSDGERSTIIMNSHYKVFGKDGELLHG